MKERVKLKGSLLYDKINKNRKYEIIENVLSIGLAKMILVKILKYFNTLKESDVKKYKARKKSEW